MEISQTLAFIGLVLIIFLVITVFKLSATISELRGKVLSLEETIGYKDRDLRHKGRQLSEMFSKIQRLEKYQTLYHAPVSKFKSRLDGMREDAAALVENVPLDPDRVKEHCEFYKAFDTISDLSKLDLSGMERERLVGFILALLDRVYITDGDREMVCKKVIKGKYSSVVIGESFIVLFKNDGSKDHVKVYFR